jgi:membrane protein DedA with SNARE-associated domain
MWSTLLAYGGYLLGSNYEAIRRVMRPFDIPIVVILLALVAYFIWKRVKSTRAADTGK